MRLHPHSHSKKLLILYLSTQSQGKHHNYRSYRNDTISMHTLKISDFTSVQRYDATYTEEQDWQVIPKYHEIRKETRQRTVQIWILHMNDTSVDVLCNWNM